MSKNNRSESDDLGVIVLSGPSGSGKTTIVNRLIKEAPIKLIKAVSATTRPARAGEIDGKDYHFLTREAFEVRRNNQEFLECAQVHGSGHWYGTLKSELQRAKDDGAWALLEIDVQGALSVMRDFPDAVTLFLMTSSEPEYEKRLRARGTESEERIQQRLASARNELKYADRYRYQVINDDLDRAVKEISDILSSLETERYA